MNRATRLREDIGRLAGRAQSPNGFLHQVSRRIRLAIPFDASSWSTTDPETLLVTGGLVENLPSEACRTYFDNELLVPDVNKYRDLARRRPSVGILTQATAGVPERSARYRELVRPLGFRGELRLAFVADGDCWGIACLFRRAGDFHPREAALLGRLCGPLASGFGPPSGLVKGAVEVGLPARWCSTNAAGWRRSPLRRSDGSPNCPASPSARACRPHRPCHQRCTSWPPARAPSPTGRTASTRRGPGCEHAVVGG